ncbi:hypothetical protein [Flavobacterium sp.]|jgi:hypothetical protein|uniref:hypothetical protein n=1 Tax=Flavobacterium sp. TaxID=239 RepID=UPI0037BF7938
MEEYLKFLELTKKKILISKNIKEALKDFGNQNDNFPKQNGFKDFFKKSEDSFKEMIKELRDLGEKEESLALMIKTEKEKRLDAIQKFLNISKDFNKDNFFKKKSEQKIIITTKSSNNTELKTLDEKPKKFSEKWHAILYLLELQAANASPPENSEGSLIKDDIEEIGRQRIKGSKGQSFYRNVLKFRLDIKDKKSLKNILTDDWKEKIISLSNNNKSIIDYIEKNY